MSSFKLVVSRPERLPSGKTSISMCVRAETEDLQKIRSVSYRIGDEHKHVEAPVGEQFLADMEVREWEGRMFESQLELADGERWQCAVALRDKQQIQAFMPVAGDSPTLQKSAKSDVDMKRLKQLEAHVDEGLKLLGECEKSLLWTRSAVEIHNCKNDIQRIHGELENWQSQYETLSTKISGDQPLKVNEIGAKLGEVNDRLGQLSGQLASIGEDVVELRQAILVRFDATRQELLSVILHRVPGSELWYVHAGVEEGVKGAISKDRSQEIINLVRQVLSELRGSASDLTDVPTSEEITRLSDAIEDPKLALEHRLEMSIPIIPFFLTYKGVTKLTSGANLDTAWQRIKARFQNKKAS